MELLMEFTGLVPYWTARYIAEEASSGAASRFAPLQQKVEILTTFIDEKGITKVFDLGCGDGHLARELKAKCEQIEYTGADLAENLIKRNQERYPWGTFKVIKPMEPIDGEWDLIICFDVLLHQPGEHYDAMIKNLQDVRSKYVAIISLDSAPPQPAPEHIFPRTFDPKSLGNVISQHEMKHFRHNLPRSCWIIEKT